ncbi:MAG: bifunctional demethylmenaquinone methyltransferase/2-methoxy-6-polyprenyl-1,4-benzoquinol methylase UbiE [Planctomycetaceae bacterium]
MNVDKSGTRVRQMFGEISGRYDFLNHVLSGGTDIYWRWRTVRLVKPQGNDPVLDVCTGTGDLAFAWYKKAHGAKVVGADFTHEMLEIANDKRDKKLKAASHKDVTFVEADTQDLPFESNAFQIVSVAFGLRNVSDTHAGLREMTRVCKPGGQVVVLEFSVPRNKAFGAVYAWYFKNILPKIGQILARNSQAAYNYLPASVSEFPHGQALADIMTECGLKDVKCKPLTFGIATIYYGTKPE